MSNPRESFKSFKGRGQTFGGRMFYRQRYYAPGLQRRIERTSRIRARFLGRRRQQEFGAYGKATRALSLIRKFKKQEERKVKENILNELVAIAGNAAQSAIQNALVLGNTNTTRIGNKVSFESMAWKGAIRPTGANATGFIARIMFVFDRRPEGIAPTWAMICQSVNCLDLYTISGNNKGRFSILSDEMYNFSESVNAQAFKGFVDLNGKAGDYSLGNGGNVGDISRGAIYFFVNCTGNASTVQFDGFCRIRYTDA